MHKPMSLSARRELLQSISPRYRSAGGNDKQHILDEFTAASGYHRKYAIALLHGVAQPPEVIARKPQRRTRYYTEEVKEPLVMIWQAANRLCSKRLVPFLPEFIPVLERLGHPGHRRSLTGRCAARRPTWQRDDTLRRVAQTPDPGAHLRRLG